MSLIVKNKRTPNSARPKGARNATLRAEQRRRREEAHERSVLWQAMTPQQQLQSLDRRGMAANRQRQRIQDRIDAGKGN